MLFSADDIANVQVREIYEGWERIWNSEDSPAPTRFQAYSMMRCMSALIGVYQYDEELDKEEIEDIFIDWGSGGIKPVFPEEYPKLVDKMRGWLDDIK